MRNGIGLIKKYNSLSLEVKATLWYTLCNLLQRGISLIVVPLYTRILTPEQYGTYNVFLSWLGIFEIVTTFRIAWGGYTVGLTKFNNRKDEYTSSMQSLSLTITSICLILYLLNYKWINYFTSLTFELTILIFCLMFTMPAISFWTARQRFEQRYMAMVTLSLISSFLIPIFGLAAVVTCEEKAIAIIGAKVLVQGTIGLFLIWVNCHKKFTFLNKEFWIRALKLNIPLLPYYFSMVILNSSDRIIINSIVGQKEAGIYGVAYSASMVMQLFSSSLNASLQPWVFKNLKESNEKVLARPICAFLAIIAVLNLSLIAWAPEAIKILAPLAYHEAIWIVPPLAASVFIMFFYQNFINVEFYFENSKMAAIASIGSAGLNVFLNLLLIPRYGYLAAGYTTLASYMVFGIKHYFFMRKICKQNNRTMDMFNIKIMLWILFGFLLISALLMIGYLYSALRYLIFIIMILAALANRKHISHSINNFR